jgi:hypothetical protein
MGELFRRTAHVIDLREALVAVPRRQRQSRERAAGKERRDLGKLLKRHGFDPRSFAP